MDGRVTMQWRMRTGALPLVVSLLEEQVKLNGYMEVCFEFCIPRPNNLSLYTVMIVPLTQLNMMQPLKSLLENISFL